MKLSTRVTTALADVYQSKWGSAKSCRYTIECLN